jgi:hypothetical protein
MTGYQLLVTSYGIIPGVKEHGIRDVNGSIWWVGWERKSDVRDSICKIKGILPWPTYFCFYKNKAGLEMFD